MIDEIEPRDDVQEDTRISRVSACDSLHVWGESGCAVEGLAGFDFGDHFSHIHIEFPLVFCPAVKTYCERLAGPVALNVLVSSGIEPSL